MEKSVVIKLLVLEIVIVLFLTGIYLFFGQDEIGQRQTGLALDVGNETSNSSYGRASLTCWGGGDTKPANISLNDNCGLLFEGFESGSLANWTLYTRHYGKNWNVSTTDPYEGNWHAKSVPKSAVSKASVMELSISTLDYSDITLSYYRKVFRDSGEVEFEAEWFNGWKWIRIEKYYEKYNYNQHCGRYGWNCEYNDDDVWNNYSCGYWRDCFHDDDYGEKWCEKNASNGYVFRNFSLPYYAGNNQKFKIRFSCRASDNDNYCELDNFLLAGKFIGKSYPKWSNPQKNATYVYPENFVEFNATWTDCGGLAGYIFSINQNGSWVNYTYTEFSGAWNVSEQIAQINASAGQVVYWRFFANNSFGRWNATSVQNFSVSYPKAELKAELIEPVGINNQPNNMTFQVRANVSCVGYINASCGNVTGVLRVNMSSEFPEMKISNESSAIPFYTLDFNPQECGIVDYNNPCSLNWSVNATGSIGEGYKIDVNFNSSNSSINSKSTNYTIIKIIASVFGIILSEPLYSVQFPEFAPGSEDNPALNNSNDGYYVICDYFGGRCNISIKANSDMISSVGKFAIGNVSWNVANTLLGRKRLEFYYQIIHESLMHMANQSLYFWIDIPKKQNAGNYASNFTILGIPN